MTPALLTVGLGKRYGSKWALHDCSVSLVPGQVTALVGPNGSGKSTLLELAAGLRRPTSGSVAVFGHDPDREAATVLPIFGFVGQDRPLYRGFSVADMLTFGRKLNGTWDQPFAERRIARLGLDPKTKVGELSGGQQAQVALVLALAKRPRLLLLDEPVAAFDPLARRDFLTQLLETVTEEGTTVLLSSHILGDLEKVCDSLVLLSASSVQLTGSMEAILASHRLLVGPSGQSHLASAPHTVIHRSESERQVAMLVRLDCPLVLADGWTVTEPPLEEIVINYMAEPAAPTPRMKEPVLS